MNDQTATATTFYDVDSSDDPHDSDTGSMRSAGQLSKQSSSVDASQSGGSSSASTTTRTSGTHNGRLKTKEEEELDQRESRAVMYSRICVLFVLLSCAAIAGSLTYVLIKREEHQDFENQFNDYAGEIAAAATASLNGFVDIIQSTAHQTTSYVLDRSIEVPFITIPHFEIIGHDFRNISRSNLLAFSPIVAFEDIDAWNNYSVTHQGWMEESWRLHGPGGEDVEPDPIVEYVFVNTEDGRQAATEGGDVCGDHVVSPLWQLAHCPKTDRVVNLDLMSHPIFREVLDTAVETRRLQASPVFETVDLFGLQALREGGFLDEEPQSLLIQPVYRDFAVNDPDAPIIGSIIASVPWHNYLKNLTGPGATGIIVVLETLGGDLWTYRIDGAEETYLGPGDLHDTTYDDMGCHTVFRGLSSTERQNSANLSPSELNSTFIDIYIYPSRHLESKYETGNAATFTSIIVLIFFFTSSVFVLYDFLVQRRQRKVHDVALKSRAIVSSLFPAEIRDRLYHYNDENEEKQEKEMRTSGLFDNGPKLRLKKYQCDDDEDEAKEDATNENDTTVAINMYDTKPIADLFPHTTVMFADISGFTAWSSVREPAQVFTLLETVYTAFDQIAKRRNVFKVETIGDCYVAVTGLPEPRDDHAVAMARFARECNNRVQQITHQLEVTLGPDTGDLTMRFGLHSGPVTAGVLRGDKSRFQLFGDTVNTAARMESTGKPERVHLSSDTAALLEKAGKSHWLVKRDVPVMAKGKGEMETYWLKQTAKKAEDSSTLVRSQETRRSQPGRHLPSRCQMTPKLDRLIVWNVDILVSLLRRVVARRLNMSHISSAEPPLQQTEEMLGKMGMTLNEVVEVVSIPEFRQEGTKRKIDPASVTLPPAVVSQLRDYVASIAAMYRQNPFHNFEHAGHVTMSVSKLLSRIIAPDIDEHDKNLAQNLHDHTYGITSDPLTQFAVVLSALIHDVDHAGVPNFLLVKESTRLAGMYDNKSVAEQNSVDLAWDILMESRFIDLRRCIYRNTTELRRFRQMLVNTVLATDIFDKELQALRKTRWENAFNTHQCQHTQMDKNRRATIVIEHLIQASDVAHTMQHWHIYQKWNERLFMEMHLAFKNGRSQKDPSENWYLGELGFFDNYIIPLAKKLKDCGVFGVGAEEYLIYALENRREWATRGKTIVKDMLEKIASDQNNSSSQDGTSSHPHRESHQSSSSLGSPKSRTRASINRDSMSSNCDSILVAFPDHDSARP